MMTPPSTRQEVTQLLGDWSGGDEGALEKLFPLVEAELHRLAHHYMSRERAGHTLQTTALVARLERKLDPVAQGLPESARTSAWISGEAMSVERAIEYALVADIG